MAEAILYGKLNMSIDYADVKNVYTGAVQSNGIPYDLYYANPYSPNASGQLEPAAPGVVWLDANGNPVIRGGTDFKGWGVSANGSYMPGAGRANRIGVKGSEDLGNGLKAIYQVELGLNLGDNNLPSGNNGISYRNSFIGLAGGFGTLLVGRHDTPLKISTSKLDMFSDTMADYNGTVGFDDLRTDNTIAYISPSLSGFSFMAAMVAGGGATTGDLPSDVSITNVNEDSLAGAYSLAAIYNNGPFYASLAYESLDSDMFMDSETSLRGSAQCVNPDGTPNLRCTYIDDAYNKWRIGLGLLDWHGFTLAAIYEDQENRPIGQMRYPLLFVDTNGNVEAVGVSANKGQSLWQIQAGYAFGNNIIKAMYGSVDRDAGDLLRQTNNVQIDNFKGNFDGDRSTWAIGLDHNFSKRTKAYVLYTAVDDDLNGAPDFYDREWSGFSLGLMHSF